MPGSDFVYESGEPIGVGTHGETDFLFHQGDPVPNTGDSEYVYEAGTGLGGAQPVVYACDDTKIYELDYDNNFSITRSHTPSFSPHGAGGDSNTIWVGDNDNSKEPTIYKLDADDFSVQDRRTVTGSIDGYDYSNVTDCGGDSRSCFMTIVVRDENGDALNKRAVVRLDEDLNIFQKEELTDSRLDATGGTTTVFWSGEREVAENPSKANLVERDADLFSIENETGFIEWGGSIVGAGGSVNRSYWLRPDYDGGGPYIQERDADLNFVREEQNPISGALGLGGM